MADITIVNGVYKPTYNWGAPSCSLAFRSSKMLPKEFDSLEVSQNEEVPPNHPKLDYLSIETHRVGDPPIGKKSPYGYMNSCPTLECGTWTEPTRPNPSIDQQTMKVLTWNHFAIGSQNSHDDIEMDPSHPQKCWVLLTSWVWLTSHSWIIGRAPLPRHHMPDVCQNSGSPWGTEAGRRCQPVNQTQKKCQQNPAIWLTDEILDVFGYSNHSFWLIKP